MPVYLRIQGALYCVVALSVALLAPFLGRLEEKSELLLVALLITLLGVPHGALDTLLAYESFRLKTLSRWLAFGVAYFVPASLVVWLWATFPSVFLVGFLVISLIHFSGDPQDAVEKSEIFTTPTGYGRCRSKRQVPLAARVLYGGAVLILPTLLHETEVARLFSWLVGTAAAAPVIVWVHRLAWPWLLAGAVAGWKCWKLDCLGGLEILATLALAVAAPPLIAFTVFFCAMHSARHILRMVGLSAQSSPRFLALASLAPTLLFMLLLGVGRWWLREFVLEAQVVQLLFVGLAAVTLPHMILVEPLRLRGWQKSRAPGPSPRR